jgi:hypothetical protein
MANLAKKEINTFKVYGLIKKFTRLLLDSLASRNYNKLTNFHFAIINDNCQYFDRNVIQVK